MPFVTLANGTRFSAEAGSSILDAALAQGVVLEHSCRTARCGSCKAQVLEGSAVALREPAALSDAEQAAGWILTCAHEARSPLRLGIDDLGALVGISTKTLPARIDSLQRLAPDVLKVVLRLPPGADFRFLAGQSIEVTGPGGIRRSYSIASDAAAPALLELQVRRVEKGRFSEHWFERAKVGDLLRFRGPCGTFFMRSVAGLDLVFLATGTGVAPICSMLAQLATLPAAMRPRSTALYWGGRKLEDLYLDVPGAGQALRYVPVLSRADAAWPGSRGHVQDVFLAGRPDLSQTAVYACGSEAMIQAARQQLTAAGLPPRRFHFDAFVAAD